MEPAGKAAVFCRVPAPASQDWVQKGRYIFTVIFTAIIQSIYPEGVKLLVDLSLGLGGGENMKWIFKLKFGSCSHESRGGD